jgi:hypothetical protein
MLNLRKIMQWVIVLPALVILGYGIADAQHSHDHGAPPVAKTDHQGMSDTMSMAGRPIQSAIVEGLKVSLDVMDMGMHVHMQGMKRNPVPDTYDSKQSQAIMVMIQSTASKETVKDANVAITIISPTGEKKTSKALWCGDHYGESFSPSEKGTYRIIVKVEGWEGKGETIFTYQFNG